MCFSCWPPSLVVRVYLWGPVWCTFMFEPHVSPCAYQPGWLPNLCLITSGLIAVYMQKLGYWGIPVCGCAGRGLAVIPCWWSLCMCVGFFLWRRSCVFFLSSCWGWGRLLLSLFWCGCSALFPGAPAVFRCVSCSLLPFLGSTPC